MDNGLAISITHADGTIARWGPDAPNAIDIPDDLTFGSSIPGGFKDLTCSLLRRIDVVYPDEALFATVRVYWAAGNETVWEGRVAQLPRSRGDSHSVTPGAVGWSAHLRDDPSFREIYIDRDLSRFGDSPLARRRFNATAARPQGKIPVTSSTGGISWLPPNEALPTDEISEAFYDAGPGLLIDHIYYQGQRTGAFTNFAAPLILAATGEDGSGGTTENLTLDGALRVATAFTPARYGFLRLQVSAATTPAAGHEQSYDIVAVVGGHGVTETAVAGDVNGILASRALTDIITRAAPLLDPSGIDLTDYPIPHLAFREPVTAADAIALINGYHAWDWGVWENRVFFYTKPDPDRLTWEARLSDGARLELEGDTAEQIFNGVVVSYQDGAGRQLTVGPPGATTDDTDAALEDTSPENPVNAYGIPRRWETLQLSEPTNLLGATTLGTVWLAQHSLPQRRGTLTLTSTVTHPTKGAQPVYMVRAGDYIRIADHSNSVARKIIETSYSHGNSTITLTLDNTAPKLEALLERLGVGRIGKW
jgi:hypothetical protein